MNMDLHPTLGALLNEFLHEKMISWIHQGTEMEVAMQLHQARDAGCGPFH